MSYRASTGRLRPVMIVTILALCVTALSGCVASFGRTSGSTATYTRGEWIQKQAQAENAQRALALRIRDALQSDPILNDADIQFRVRKHTIVLTGEMHNLANYRHAVKVVRNVDGVESVTARIQLTVIN